MVKRLEEFSFFLPYDLASFSRYMTLPSHRILPTIEKVWSYVSWACDKYFLTPGRLVIPDLQDVSRPFPKYGRMAQNGTFRAIWAGLAFTITALIASPILAQVTLPGAAEPGRNDELVVRTPLVPLAEPDAAAATQDTEILAADTGATFVLNQIVISGSTVFSDSEFHAIYDAYIGTKIDAGVVFQIAAKATALYRREGYILSQVIVPPQEVDGGVVQLRAVEGFVDNVVVEGELGSKRGLVAEYVSKITASRPLRADVLERYLLLAGDLAGLSIEGIFSPSDDTTGASTLTVKSEYDWFEGSFAAVNNGSDAVGPWLANTELTFNSVLGMHERITLKGGVAAELRELQVGEVQISTPVGSEGTNFFARLSASNSEPGNGLEVHGVKSTGTRWSVGGKHAVIRSRRKNLFIGLQFDWDDLKSDSVAFGTLSDDHLRVVRANAEYDFVDTALGAPAVTAMRATLSQGLSAFGATTSTDPFKSRTNADGNFTSLSAEVQRQQRLGNSRFGLLLAARAQYTNAPLLASEEFGFGGADYGRGYDPSTITGDRGLAGKAELQYNGDPGSLGNVLESYQLYAFLDAGIVENINFDGLGNDQSQSLWSTGGGVRLGLVNDVDMDFALAYRGNDSSSVQNLGLERWRALFKLEAHF